MNRRSVFQLCNEQGCGRCTSAPAQVVSKGLHGHFRQIDDSVALAFALTHTQALTWQVEILVLQFQTLAGAQAAVRQNVVTGVFQGQPWIRGCQATAYIGFQALRFRWA